MKPILEIQNISKTFRIQHEQQPYLSLRDSIASIFKPSTKTTEEFYALRDISFNVQQGETIGIIGKNGAGKSTLLKILSKITPPSSGKIISRGRIASLLEVGTGFHPELSGRENVFLNGSILGMKKIEILKNFDQIVEFSGVENFIDTPLKHYSSGMQLRLAFAVAAFLENEILIIDEVLAVGDAEFQKKCMGKMDDVSKSGRTVLFVSHNMGSIAQLCTKGIVLKNGKIDFMGNITDSISSYLNMRLEDRLFCYESNTNKSHTQFINKIFFSSGSNQKTSFLFDEIIEINFNIKNIKNSDKQTTISFILKDNLNQPVFASHCLIGDNEKEEIMIQALIPRETLLPGSYFIDVLLHIPNIEFIEKLLDIVELCIEDTWNIHTAYSNKKLGSVHIPVIWEKR